MTSRTAERWPVRVGARWMARIQGVSGHIRLASLGVTAFSTFSLLLEQMGLGAYIPYIGVAGVGGLVVFAYLYAEAGVWNQVLRDQRDMSGNHAHPGQRIDDELIGVAVASAMKGRALTDDERAAVAAELDRAWGKYRDGYEIARADGGGDSEVSE